MINKWVVPCLLKFDIIHIGYDTITWVDTPNSNKTRVNWEGEKKKKPEN